MILKEDRIFYLDELRTLAILFVLLAHTIQFFPVNIDCLISPTLLSYLTISRMGVPLFFMLSGALLINKEYTLSNFIKRRFSRVLIPVIFWQIVIFILYWGMGITQIPDWYYQTNISWFIFAIIGIYLVIPIYNSFINEYGIKGASYCLFIWLILMILTNLNLYDDYYVSLLFNNFGKYIGYAILGYYLFNKDFNIYSLPMIIFNIIIFITCLSINIYFAYYFTQIFYIESISIIIQCSALFLILRYLSKFALFNPKNIISKVHNFIKDSFIGRLIYLISIYSFTIFLMHGIVVNMLLEYMPITKFDMLPVIFMLLFSISFVITFILSKIPILNKLIGVY